jgi:hypothetical protein
MRPKATSVIVTVLLGLAVSTVAAQTSADYTESTIRKILSRRWENKMISSGDNFPSANLRRDALGEVAALLHYGIPKDAILGHYGWTQAEFDRRLETLVEAELVRTDGEGGHHPTFLVLGVGDAARYFPVAAPLVAQAAAVIEEHLSEVRARYAGIDAFRGIPFEDASLLILSDVLLDNWQINEIERRVVGAERPLRAGSRYYYSMQEVAPWRDGEAFGIYGNQMGGVGDWLIGVYGNRRRSDNLQIATARLRALFGAGGPEGADEYQRYLVDALARSAADPQREAPPELREGFEAVGVARDGRVLVPVLSDADQTALDGLAAIVEDDLVALLQDARPDLEAVYRESPYAQEITFEEWFIWWYHLFYTAVTDRLIVLGHIAPPPTGNTTYLMAR